MRPCEAAAASFTLPSLELHCSWTCWKCMSPHRPSEWVWNNSRPSRRKMACRSSLTTPPAAATAHAPCHEVSHPAKEQSAVAPAHLIEGAHAVDLICYNLDGLPRLIGDLVCPCLCLQPSHDLQTITRHLTGIIHFISMGLVPAQCVLTCIPPFAKESFMQAQVKYVPCHFLGFAGVAGNLPGSACPCPAAGM